MAGNIKGITIELNGDSTKLTKAIDGVKRQSIGLQSELKEIDKLLKLEPGNADLIAQKQQNLGRQVEATAEKLKVLKQAQQQVEAQFASGTLSVEQYNSFQREVVSTEMALRRYEGQLQSIDTNQQNVQRSTKQLDTLFQATGTSIDQYADVLGTDLLRAIQTGTASSSQLETALNQIGRAALNSEIDVDRMRQALSRVDDGGSLNEARQELARVAEEANASEIEVNGFGNSLKEVIAGLATGSGIAAIVSQALDVSSLDTKIDITFDVPESSKASVKEAIKGIEAYGVDGEAALAGVQRQWALNKGASDESNRSIIDQVGVIASAYEGIDFNELVQESYEMGKSMGISQEEALGLTNTLLKTGFPAEQLDIISEYGTQMKMAGYSAEEIQAIMAAGVETGTWNIDNLLDGVKEGRIKMTEFGQEVPKSMKEMLAGTDISAKQLQKWGQDVSKGGKAGSKAMSEVSKALVGVEDETQRNALGVALFGTKYEDQGSKITDTLINAANETVNLKDNQENLNNSVDKMNADPAVQMQKAISDIKTAVAPLLLSIVAVVGSIATWVSQNSQLAAVIAIVVAGVGLVVGIFTALAPIVMTISTIVAGVGTAFAGLLLPIIGIIAAVVAFIALGVLIYKNWGGISEFFVNLWSNIKTAFSTAITSIGEFLSSTWSSITNVVKAVWNGIKLYFTTVLNIYKTIFSTAWNGIKTSITVVWNAIKTIATAVFNGIKIYFTTVLNIYKKIFSTAWNGIKTVVTTVFNSIKTTITTIFNAIKNISSSVWNGIKNAISKVVNGIKSVILSVFNGIKSTISSVSSAIKSSIASAWNSAKSTVSAAVNGIKSVVSSVFNGIKSVVSSAMSGVKSAISTTWNSAKSTVSVAVNGIKSVVTSIFNSLKTVVGSAMLGVKSAITSGWNTAKSFLNGISLSTVGRNIIQGLVNGIKGAAGSVSSAIKSVADGAVSSAKKALGIHSPSRVMRDQVGFWVSEGLAKGIKANKKPEKVAKEKAQVIVKTYQSKLKDLDKKYSAGMIDTKNYTNSLKKLKSAYGTVSGATTTIDSKIAKANSKTAIANQKKKQEKQAKLSKAFNNKMTLYSNQNKAGILSDKQYIKKLNNMKKTYSGVTNAVSKIDVKIASTNSKIVKEKFSKDKAYYTQKSKNSKTSLTSELKILNTLSKGYKKNSDERIYFEKLAKEKKQEILTTKANAEKAYIDKVKKLNSDYVTEYKALTEKYTQAVDDRTNAIASFAGIFDDVSLSNVSGARLLENLKGQTSTLENWMTNLGSLAKKGLDKGLLAELQELGPKSAGEIAALNTLSNAQLTEYTSIWKKKTSLARTQAVGELEWLRIDTANEIVALQKKTEIQLTLYKNEWEKAMKEVVGNVKNLNKEMTSVGANTVQGLIKGITSKKKELSKVAAELASIVAKTTKTKLDIHSPSRVMKKLGGYTTEGFVIGMQEAAQKLSTASANVFSNLSKNADVTTGSLTGSSISRSVDNSKSQKNEINVYTQESPEKAIERTLNRMAFKFA